MYILRDAGTLAYGAWKLCRNLIGSHCLALRKLTGNASKPLLWTTSAGPDAPQEGNVYLRSPVANF